MRTRSSLSLAHELPVARGEVIVQLSLPTSPCLERAFAPCPGRAPFLARERVEKGAQPEFRVSHQRERTELVGVARHDVEADEAHTGVLEQGMRARCEVDQARADADHEVRLARQGVGRTRAGDPHTTHGKLAVRNGALSGGGLGHRDAAASGQLRKLRQRAGVVDPATGDHQRPLAVADRLDRRPQFGVGRGSARDKPRVRLEQAGRKVARLGLDVLMERERDRSGLRGIQQDPHRLGQRAHELLRARDAVEVGAQRPEGVVHRQVRLERMLERLHDRPLAAVGEGVGRKQEDGDAVHGCRGRASEHVRGARSDRRAAGERREEVVRTRVADRRVNHRLLVLRLVEAERAPLVLLERRAKAAHVAVTEDPEDARNRSPPLAVALSPLPREEAHDGLSGG